MPLYKTEHVDAAWFDENIPCMQGCPVLTNAGRYVTAVAAQDDRLAYLTARLPNPVPSICGRICAAPCEARCRRGLIDEPIAIRALKRYVCERFGAETWGDSLWREVVRKQPKRAERVAVIGSGPAGLSCAHNLATFGYEVTIFEAQNEPGGMMVLGIPEYRLRRDVLRAEIDAILNLGVELRTGFALGRNLSIADLRAEGFAAFFLATGAMRSRELDIPGVSLDGVLRAVEFLINANLGFRVDVGRRVVVIGGGSVALDAARSALRAASMHAPRTHVPRRESTASDTGTETAIQEPPEDGVEAAAMATLDVARSARRLGAAEVTVMALESEDEMPADRLEIEEALEEGIEIVHRVGPKRLIGRHGQVAGIETLDVASVFDPDGRFNPRLIADTERITGCDTVVLAIGQSPDVSFLTPEDGVEVTPRGTIAVDATTLATSAPGIYAGGDVAFGPRNLIDAVANGLRAAGSIHGFLARESPQQARPSGHTSRGTPQRLDSYDDPNRTTIPTVPGTRRVGLEEIELGFDSLQARREAGRCLQCMFNIELRPKLCVLCGGCVDVCPMGVLRIIPDWEVEGIAKPEDGSASLLVLEEDRCIRCGLCVQRCPSGALVMTEWQGTGLVTEAS